MNLSSLLLLLACQNDSVGDDSASSTVDLDGDGYIEDDCGPNDAGTFPGAPELCDGVDNDCDGALAWGEGDENSDGALDCLSCEAAGYWSALAASDDPVGTAPSLLEGDACASGEYSTVTTWMFERLDAVDDQVECVYTGRVVDVSDGKPDGSDMNTEHAWPQSQGASEYPARCDLNHLFPSDAYANGRRGNLPFGEVSSVDWEQGGSKLGTDSSGTDVFEPRDVSKGDIARAMLYVNARYDADLWGQQALLESWSQADPPSADEIARSLAIGDYQAQANPWVVCPIW
ncbi:MAG: endonuclease [Myxococcota bacterium]|nr:endonuclease [Myxococcota bacterium]